MFSVEDVDHSEYTDRQLLSVPAAVLSLAILIILVLFVTTGAPAHLGTEFTGGVEVTITEQTSMDKVTSDFSGIEGVPDPEVQSTQNGYLVTYPPLDTEQLNRVNNFADENYDQVSVDQISPTYGESLQRQGVGAVIFAFVIMSITVFAFFRTFVPSMAVVLSAFSDMIVPIGVMNLLGIPLSLGTIPAILLLIGYSIDSDILLTRNVLKGRRSKFYENVKTAMGTGITMTTTSMAAMFAMAVVSHFASIFLLRDIGIILFVGLGIDIVNTYMMNVVLLRWHMLGRNRGGS